MFWPHTLPCRAGAQGQQCPRSQTACRPPRQLPRAACSAAPAQRRCWAGLTASQQSSMMADHHASEAARWTCCQQKALPAAVRPSELRWAPACCLQSSRCLQRQAERTVPPLPRLAETQARLGTDGDGLPDSQRAAKHGGPAPATGSRTALVAGPRPLVRQRGRVPCPQALLWQPCRGSEGSSCQGRRSTGRTRRCRLPTQGYARRRPTPSRCAAPAYQTAGGCCIRPCECRAQSYSREPESAFTLSTVYASTPATTRVAAALPPADPTSLVAGLSCSTPSATAGWAAQPLLCLCSPTSTSAQQRMPAAGGAEA